MSVCRSVCCCCLRGSSLRSLLLPYSHNGEMEVYADMIQKCYDIQMISTDENIDKKLYMICNSCVSRLREAFLFRLQVEVACESIEKELRNCNYFAEEQSTSRKVASDVHNVEVTFDDRPTGNDGDLYYCRVNEGDKQINLKVEPVNIEEKYSETLNDTILIIGKEKDDSKKYDRKKINGKKMKDIKEQPYKLDKNDLTCKICNETFARHFTLVSHMSVHFPNYVCHICSKFYITKRSLGNHIRRHQQCLIPQTCQVCNKTYKGIENLKQHMRHHNREKNIYKCPQCTEKFSSYYSRIKHLIDIHNDEPKKYKCKICPKRYYQANALSHHVKTSHLREKKYTCQVCEVSFFAKSTLTGHMIKHSNIKKFHCEVCNKSFAKRFTLNEHMKIHNNVKNWVCTVCSRAFTQKCTLKGHMKVHEKETQSNPSLNSINQTSLSVKNDHTNNFNL
ncbi:uncharacterized protein LOC143917875 [Arctopsyche grandis]|uniref:uncharacterized protein LOC143917875 n=1 Tax=Arctopsyche grandis TaxID=121162 RepID=UPI00406DA39C